jgi:hypothetical protein
VVRVAAVVVARMLVLVLAMFLVIHSRHVVSDGQTFLQEFQRPGQS